VLPRSVLAVVERARPLTGQWATEPFEAGWAHEAIGFIRLLEEPGANVDARIQISPDGIEWVDEGTRFPALEHAGLAFARVVRFGNWLRIVGTVAGEHSVKAIVYWALKE
jgi:hypothetical protein